MPEITKHMKTFEQLMLEVEKGVAELSVMLDDERRRTAYYVAQVRQKEEIISKLRKPCDAIVRYWESADDSATVDEIQVMDDAVAELKELMIEHSLMEGDDDNT